MNPDKTIFLSALFFASLAGIYGQSYVDFLNKPHVLPAAEKYYHAVYHELDSERVGGSPRPVFGQIYVALIEDQFTFGGDLDSWGDDKFERSNRSCKPFMATNVHHLCDDNYFLVHQDMIKLQKTVFGPSDNQLPDLKTVCDTKDSGFDDFDNKEFLLYRYHHRIPMTYKKSVDHNKCIGTYDERTDTFTCMFNDKETTKLVPLEIQNFLWNQDDGQFARGSGNVEVFCKQLHYK